MDSRAFKKPLLTIMPVRRRVLTLNIPIQALCHTAFPNKATAHMGARINLVQYPLLFLHSKCTTIMICTLRMWNNLFPRTLTRLLAQKQNLRAASSKYLITNHAFLAYHPNARVASDNYLKGPTIVFHAYFLAVHPLPKAVNLPGSLIWNAI